MDHSVVNFTFFRKRGFTFIEVVVAVALLAILATLVTLQLRDVRRAARDGRRLADVQTYVGALGQYLTATGTLFVTDSGSHCTFQMDNQGEIMSATGPDCTGVAGLGYGLMNASATTVTGFGGNERQYAATSINKALENRGYLTAIGHDPTFVEGGGGEQLDYILIRCCANNSKQNRSTTGQAFAVWAVLERDATPAELSTTNHSCGAKVLQSDGQAVYDFGITDAQGGTPLRQALEAHGVAVGNAGLLPISDLPCCSTDVAVGN